MADRQFRGLDALEQQRAVGGAQPFAGPERRTLGERRTGRIDPQHPIRRGAVDEVELARDPQPGTRCAARIGERHAGFTAREQVAHVRIALTGDAASQHQPQHRRREQVTTEFAAGQRLLRDRQAAAPGLGRQREAEEPHLAEPGPQRGIIVADLRRRWAQACDRRSLIEEPADGIDDGGLFFAQQQVHDGVLSAAGRARARR
jgi:hypothetical protein